MRKMELIKKFKIREYDWEWLLNESNKKLEILKEKYDTYDFSDEFNKNYIFDMIKKVGGNSKKDLHSLGSLGGGNHYVEVNVDDEENAFLTVHSGSRNLGFRVCNYHQDKIDDYYKFKWEV